MPKIDPRIERFLMHKINNSSRTNIYEWLEKICDELCEEQAIGERSSLTDVKKIFYDNFHESFFVTIPKLLFKFSIDHRVGHIFQE